MEKKEKMFALVKLWEKSGLTQKDFALKNGIKVPTFNNWVTKYLNQSNRPTTAVPTFKEISPRDISSEHEPQPKAQLEFEGGLKITIY